MKLKKEIIENTFLLNVGGCRVYMEIELFSILNRQENRGNDREVKI